VAASVRPRACCSPSPGNDLPVVIDLSRIDFIDSSGLGALVQLAKQCNDTKTHFQVVGNARVTQTVKLVRLEEFLHLQPDLETALGSLSAA
jgi:anti-anti-sigma factor